TRFVNYEKKLGLSFVYPKPEDLKLCRAGCAQNIGLVLKPWELPVHTWPDHERTCEAGHSPRWCALMASTCETYAELLREGWRPQEARSVLPNALASRIVVTTNLRNWRHLFIMRTTKEAHPQMRQVMDPLLAEFKQK